jgi:DNA polymerase III epsilon subunit-like protein
LQAGEFLFYLNHWIVELENADDISTIEDWKPRRAKLISTIEYFSKRTTVNEGTLNNMKDTLITIDYQVLNLIKAGKSVKLSRFSTIVVENLFSQVRNRIENPTIMETFQIIWQAFQISMIKQQKDLPFKIKKNKDSRYYNYKGEMVFIADQVDKFLKQIYKIKTDTKNSSLKSLQAIDKDLYMLIKMFVTCCRNGGTPATLRQQTSLLSIPQTHSNISEFLDLWFPIMISQSMGEEYLFQCKLEGCKLSAHNSNNVNFIKHYVAHKLNHNIATLAAFVSVKLNSKGIRKWFINDENLEKNLLEELKRIENGEYSNNNNINNTNINNIIDFNNYSKDQAILDIDDVLILLFDLETTGFGKTENIDIYEIFMTLLDETGTSFYSLIQSNKFKKVSFNKRTNSYFIHSGNKEQIKNAPERDKVKKLLLKFIEENSIGKKKIIFLAHNGNSFDFRLLKHFLGIESGTQLFECELQWTDTIDLVKKCIGSSSSILNLIKLLGIDIPIEQLHSAKEDCIALRIILKKLCEKYLCPSNCEDYPLYLKDWLNAQDLNPIIGPLSEKVFELNQILSLRGISRRVQINLWGIPEYITKKSLNEIKNIYPLFNADLPKKEARKLKYSERYILLQQVVMKFDQLKKENNDQEPLRDKYLPEKCVVEVVKQKSPKRKAKKTRSKKKTKKSRKSKAASQNDMRDEGEDEELPIISATQQPTDIEVIDEEIEEDDEYSNNKINISANNIDEDCDNDESDDSDEIDPFSFEDDEDDADYSDFE